MPVSTFETCVRVCDAKFRVLVIRSLRVRDARPVRYVHAILEDVSREMARYGVRYTYASA